MEITSHRPFLLNFSEFACVRPPAPSEEPLIRPELSPVVELPSALRVSNWIEVFFSHGFNTLFEFERTESKLSAELAAELVVERDEMVVLLNLCDPVGPTIDDFFKLVPG